MVSVTRSARIPLRVGIVRAASAIVLAALAIFALSVYLFVYLPLRHDLAVAQLRVASEQVEGRLRGLIERVEAVARISRDWGRNGLLDIEQPERFNAIVRPLLIRGPQLAGMATARDTGRELLLVRAADGRWVNRLTDPAVNGRQARFMTWDDAGRLVAEESREVDYDARRRPWFTGAMALTNDDAIFWTAPFIFRSLAEPGLSAVVRWTSADGHRQVLSTDIRLADLSRLTRETAVGESGFVAVFSGDGKLIGVPRGSRPADDAALQSAMLQPLESAGSATLTEAVRLWRSAGAKAAAPLTFSVDGTAWVATFSPSHFGSQTFWVGTMAPEADFSPANAAQAALVALLVLLTLLLAWIGSARLARHLSRPLESLAEHSGRIGRLELDRAAGIDSPWVEVDALARAHDAMRLELQAATRGLADANSRLEARVRERTQQLALAKDAADAANRAKAEFLANMSHEIRTPMNAILGLTDLALRAALDERQRDWLTRSRAAAASLLGIIDDILDFSKIEAGKLEMERSDFALRAVFDKVALLIGQRAQAKGLELLMHIADDVPPVLVGDALRLEQVLVNLCANAVKFTPQGEIVATVRLQDRSGGRVRLRFSVRDTGVGLSPEQIGRLFQPFNQVDTSTTRTHGGTGLGLAICRRLVVMMDGEIGVDSRPGDGSEFHFSAEFGIGDSSGVPATAPLRMPQEVRVLVVDDGAASREILLALLQDLGCEASAAASGAAALAALDAQVFDLVLIDGKLTGSDGLDGFALAQRIRERDAPPPRLVLVTAFCDESGARRAAAIGLDGCLAKPASASSLLDAIMTAFGPVARAAWADSAPGLPAPPALRGRSVLLVEDNEFNQIVAREFLASIAGMQVTVAGNGREALDRLRDQRFDVVLMDVQMPLMDGLQAAAAIRRDLRHAGLPIIAMTAHAMAGDREQCLAAGMNDYVSKPFDPAALFAVIAKWLVPAAADGAGGEGSGLSFETGLRRCVGRVDLYERLLRRFAATHARAPEAIRAAVGAGDAAGAAVLAHDLVSSAGTIGAETLSRLARDLQRALEGGDAATVQRLIGEFEREHARVRAQLEARLGGAAAAGA